MAHTKLAYEYYNPKYINFSGNVPPEPTFFVTSIDWIPPNTQTGNGAENRNFLRIGDSIFAYGSVLNPSDSSEYILDGIYGSGPIWKATGYNPAGSPAWAPNTYYQGGYIVNSNGTSYICVASGTSNSDASKYPSGNSGTGIPAIRYVQLAVPDGYGNGTGQCYNPGSAVDNFILFDGHPIDIILKILTSTGNGTNGAYDVYPKGQGIGLPVDQINVNGFLNQKSLMGFSLNFYGYFSDETQALKFLEDHIYQQAHIFVYINRSGQIDCTAILATNDTSGAITLNQDNIIGDPQFDGNQQTGGHFYNDIQINYNYKPITDYFSYILESAAIGDSWQVYEEQSRLTIDAKMISATYDSTYQMFSSNGWIYSDGWSGSYMDGFKHKIPSLFPLEPLSYPIPPQLGISYKLVYTITGRTAGSVVINFGGSSYPASSNGTTTQYLDASTSNGNLIVYPTSDFNGTMTFSANPASPISNQAIRCNDIYLSRFKRPPPIITCNTFDALHLLDPSKICIVNHPNIPNYKTGADGGAITCQVMKVDPQYPTGKVQLTLLAIGWHG